MAEISLKRRKSSIQQPTIWRNLFLSVYKYYFSLLAKLFKKFSNHTWSELIKKTNPTWAVKNDRHGVVDISCITSRTTMFQLFTHVTAHSCAGGLKKKMDLWSGSHAIDSLTCPSKHPFYGHSGKPDTSFTQWDPSVVKLRLRSNPLSNKRRSRTPILVSSFDAHQNTVDIFFQPGSS